jgi:hypothetical protein
VRLLPSTGVTPLLRYAMSRSDSRSALTHFTGTPLIGLDAPRPPLRWHPKGLTAGAETGLSCFHDGCLTVPRPLRRRVLWGCSPSSSPLPWPSPPDTRLGSLLAPCGGNTFDAAGFASCCGPASCTLPRRVRPRATTPRSPRTPAGCYKGALVPPSAGLAPASRREHQDAMPGRVLGDPVK